MGLSHIGEPELEFAGGLRHIDPRAGIAFYGPVDALSDFAPRQIRVGMVGEAGHLEQLRRWLERCAGPITAKKSHQRNLFPDWPGCNVDVGYRSRLIFDDRAYRPLSGAQLRRLAVQPMQQRVAELVDLYAQELQSLADDGQVQVILCVRPDALLEDLDETGAPPRELRRRHGPEWHDLLKARAIGAGRPIQVLRPQTFGAASSKVRGRRPPRAETMQDEATRAWNLHTALYYKAGGAPWRLSTPRSQESVCFVGISFFQSADGSEIHTGIAQVFDELGDGVITRGGEARRSARDRQVHLAHDDARELMAGALDLYRRHHRTAPARVVVHKSSAYDEAEIRGFDEALDKRDIFASDLVWLTRGDDVRLLRNGKNPPLRGTLLTLDEDRHALYAKGTVPYYRAYPGMYVPRPLGLRTARAERSGRDLATEILGLTKLNWNQTQMDGGTPITLRIADQVGRVLKHVDGDAFDVSRYAFYM